MGNFNVMKHGFVPEHHLVPKEDENEILETLEVGKQDLPKILKSDPVIEQMEKVHGDIEEGRLIEVVRESKTAGVAKVYRLVISR
ncbi:MAG: DNA-directed RNA polymerase subunit H [Thermoplasmatota archaeon]